ncbi:MAG: hypothetical protein BZY75_05990 [SAR202 cluster bacterium Io17-Chloro-G7]|nr:MAG: hypothetical protein BZY75_05990 [SAR202 cluster bacterium Io17-Chloro-G7]
MGDGVGSTEAGRWVGGAVVVGSAVGGGVGVGVTATVGTSAGATVAVGSVPLQAKRAREIIATPASKRIFPTLHGFQPKPSFQSSNLIVLE